MQEASISQSEYRMKAVIRSKQAQLTTGMTWVTPSPESMTVPVRDRSSTYTVNTHEGISTISSTSMYTGLHKGETLNSPSSSTK